MKKIICLIILCQPLSLFGADSIWILKQSTITYLVFHPFHDTEGVSHAAKGKGECKNGSCEFLAAAEVKSFDSGDSNRDIHMIQSVKGGENPIVSVRTSVSETNLMGDFPADLSVNFAGQEIQYSGVKFTTIEKTYNQFHVKGSIPLDLEKHKVKRPSLLGVKVKKEAPISVDLLWIK